MRIKAWWADNRATIIFMILCAIAVVTFNWLMQSAHARANAINQLKYAGYPIDYSLLPEGSYRTISAQRHRFEDGAFEYALVRDLADRELRLVSNVPREYFQDGATFTIKRLKA